MNYVTSKADFDSTIDETTWGFSGYSREAGSRLMNKAVSKGESFCVASSGQITILIDIHHR